MCVHSLYDPRHVCVAYTRIVCVLKHCIELKLYDDNISVLKKNHAVFDGE